MRLRALVPSSSAVDLARQEMVDTKHKHNNATPEQTAVQQQLAPFTGKASRLLSLSTTSSSLAHHRL